MRLPYLTGTLLLLASCVAPVPAPAPPDPYTALERACLEGPLDARAWDALAEALRAGGEHERAAAMARQAATLRTHDLRGDLAVVAASTAPAAAPESARRIELRRVGAAMIELRYAAAPPPAPVSAAAAPAPALRLEISNGNGVAGMAARLGRELEGEQWKVVRLSNLRPYAERTSRIEYGPRQQAAAQALARRLQVEHTVARADYRLADVKVVLGRDVRK